ncbi:membrane protein insertase YidC [Gardnerella vaginalis]|uniref:membrane protein insertase YidC n=1 Tax=Gardnerella vaginalis TaxID=2702 RepID=UPI00200FD9FD|nr:membrane protein insertase YidC [Gardnerella vaginalis]MDK7259867.1 membrane protein insertase YidC [Gardnerella vaginalis]MDK8776632.1 membrane protein insertase YidC [Gardnerella vaginalis]UQA78315.1 membrane protein insertase YidC [Gardnerella vaginalis]UQA81938.1 membrane protein insertase YidC [Gardnerella vaginalis]
MFNQDHFLLDNGIWGWFYKILTPVEWLMTQVMSLFHKLFVLIGMNEIGFSWVLSIVFLVLVVHACIFPAFIKSIKGMRNMQAIAPKMKKIQQKYKGKSDSASKEAMQREMMKLYQENNANPAGSCLPMMIQGPAFMSIWYTLSVIPFIARGKHTALGAFDVATAQQFVKTHVFGVGVSDTFMTVQAGGKVVIVIFVILMCAAMWYMQFNNIRKNLPPESKQGPQYTMQKLMMWGFPLIYVFSAFALPFAMLVYWLVNNIMNMLRSIWQVYAFPTPGSPAAEEKEKRDYKNESERRKREGLPSIEEEKLQKAREEAKRREAEGFQRKQPTRKRKNK